MLTLTDEFFLEAIQELQGQLVIGGQSLVSDDSLHRGSILADSILGVLRRYLCSREVTHQLVRYIAVILACQFLADGALHKARQGREDVDGRVDLAIV